MKVLMIGDIIGKPGRDIVKKFIFKKGKNYDFIIANGENAAGGFGITEKIANELFSYGIDVITSGNHIWDKKEVYSYLSQENRLLRPLNYPKTVPGFGSVVIERDNLEIGIINLQGRIFMGEIDSPFTHVEEELTKMKEMTKNIIVDFHAEASSEKMAMGYFLDGKVSCIYGTHTHVLTADNKILRNGTGYITDIGMSGGTDGIIGMKKEEVLEKFVNILPQRFKVSKDLVRLNGVEVEINENNGRCKRIDRIDISGEDLT